MAYLRFTLEGDIALWRNPFEPVGSFSSLGPAPSQIAGLIGAALGLPSPRSFAAEGTSRDHLKRLHRKGVVWPVSPELLQWQEENDYAVACRWMGGHPRRVQWNVNGYKALSGADSADNLRLIQTVIEEPKYEVLVRLRDLQAAQEAAAALRQPAFPLYLGTAFCRAFVRDVEVKHDLSELDTDEIPWAYWAQELTIGEAVPFSRHVVNDDEAAERIVSRGFWVYPTPAHPPPQDAISEDPCVTGYMRL